MEQPLSRMKRQHQKSLLPKKGYNPVLWIYQRSDNTTKYTYSDGATYQSENTPITIAKIPTGEYKINVVKGDYKGKATFTTSPGTQNLTIKITNNEVYGFRIAVNSTDPSTRVTYPQTIHGQENMAYGFTPASGTGANCMNSWDGCPLISGIHRQLGNSTDGWVDIANTASWQAGSGSNDMMTFIPTWYMKMTNDGTYIDCAFSKTQIDNTWKDYAGSVGSNRIGHFRVGCFAGYNSSSKLYSRGRVKPTVNTSIDNFITYAKARGTGYDIMTWYQWTYLAALAVLLYKSTDLQSAMVGGYVGGSGVQAENALECYNNYGMAGGTNTTVQMSFFWIQNLWGNICYFVGGAMTDSAYRLMTCTGYSSATGSDFDKTALTSALGSDISGYISKVTGTTETGFFPSECSGSSSTYFTDWGSIYPSYFPSVGGYVADGSLAGPFLARFGYMTTDFVGSRLSYRL